ncbi:UDP-Gal:betaGlcNAc beta 1,4- galactosyltransferase, polypeptide 4 S homeolog [Xenopus laevis]|uniref:Beta-1,4-galactosyltransferase n=1 Tax=Xenopus laevis TaxID=8355 RepID=Q6GLP1_XENLA|nr:UDP-Gal:betaGlcNAc beta 1,4- galactosyltransferase, polypeptide 4 S homeolog [Xenopus laevis]AAH74419.1 MGC84436 protein [Xenopus laevis]
MGLSSSVSQMFCRIRILVIICLCLLLFGWAALNSADVARYAHRFKQPLDYRWRATSMDNEEERQHVTAEETAKETVKLCPALSPLLRGAVPLKFEPSLSLNQVKKENPQVENGRYQPESCKAQQKVAILIPHRNRERHLLYLLKHLHPFLQRQQLDYGIYVIHQAGNQKFNRAKLLNIGYLEALKQEDWDCFIFHDVDLIPENDFNLYLCDTEPKHLVVGRNVTGYRLRYKGYFGGVTAMTREQFDNVNGYSNNYWGWGGEDDDLRQRVVGQKMKVVRPPAEVARYTMIFHTRDSGNEVNSQRMKLLNKVSRVWRKDGLNSCAYELLSVEHDQLYINLTAEVGRPEI